MNSEILRAIKDWCIGRFPAKGECVAAGELESKIREIKSEILNGFTFGYTEDGSPGFKEPNGDKFIAFNQVSVPVEPSEKKYHLNWDSKGQYNAKTYSWDGSLGINPNEIKTITLNGQISITSTSGGSGYSHLDLRGTKIGAANETRVKSIKDVAAGNKNVKMTSAIENYIINVDEDIDWTVWDKEKPIKLFFYGNSNYTCGSINADIDLIAKSNSSIDIFHYIDCRNYDGNADGGLIFYNPELLKKIHLSGELKAYNQASYLYERGCIAGSSNFTNISTIKSLASGQTANIDADCTIPDWNVYDSDKGIKFYMYPAPDTSSPGRLIANVTYTVE